MKIRSFACTALTAGLAFITLQTTAATTGPSVQALLGAVQYDDLEIAGGSGTSAGVVDISTMPQIGGAWSTAPKGDRLQFGLECSFLLGFNFDSASYSPSSTTKVYVDYDVWTFDIAGGLYANLFLGRSEKIRIYAAGGPLIMPILIYSESYEDNTIGNDFYYRNNESSFGYGLYGRAGFEFRIHETGMLGLGVRGTWIDTDLSETSDLLGMAGFVTYTAAL